MIAADPPNQPIPLPQRGELDAALASHKHLVRTHLGLAPTDVVLISALSCSQPDCPPVETVVVVLDEGHRKWTFPVPPHELTDSLIRHQLTTEPQGHLPHDENR